jgi:uncharacterized RDD family membrane protein YckC
MFYTGRLEYAGLGKRAAAKIIDFIIVYGVILAFIAGVSDMMQKAPQAVQVGVFFSTYFFMVGFNAAFLERFGATPGKLLLKLKVVRPDGERLTPGRAFGRACAELLSSVFIPLFIGYFIAAGDAEKRTVHDRIADTRVVTR